MNQHHKINYVEFQASNLPATKAFFESAFGWKFKDFSPNYTAFSGEGLDGGFFKSDKAGTISVGGALIVFFSADLKASLQTIQEAGGVICKPIFSFPGGRRFHFTEPSGNEFAIWSDRS